MFVFGKCSASDGLTTINGRYLQLISDLPPSPVHESYVKAFDEAVPLWLAYFNRDAAAVADWRMTGYLMSDKAAFEGRGLVTASLPPFTNAFQSGNNLWVVNQPSDYYTTLLLLHEGVHGIAFRLFGGAGPPWYMEGTAEFLATHLQGDDGLRIGIVPQSQKASMYWGRLGLIAQRRDEGQVPTIESVMRYGDTAHREVEPYAWSWAAITLMEMYPEYRERLRGAAIRGRDQSPQFTREFYSELKDQWPKLVARWHLLCDDLDYGFDPVRHHVDLPPTSVPAPAGEATMKLACDAGWQAVGFVVRKGQRIEVRVTGEYRLGEDPRWRSQADGVTIEYHRGRPLGCVIGCVVPLFGSTDRFLPKLDVVTIGSKHEVTAPVDGWLLLKVNDQAGDYGNNQGSLDVVMRQVN